MPTPPPDGQAASDKVDTDEADEVIDAIAKTVAELTSQQDGVIRQQVIEQLMRQITTPSFAVKRRPPQSALTRSTDGGSDRLEHGDQFDPTPMSDRPGGHWPCSQNRTHAPSLLQNTRLSSNEANPLSRSRN